jgi:hypothetical protein
MSVIYAVDCAAKSRQARSEPYSPTCDPRRSTSRAVSVERREHYSRRSRSRRLPGGWRAVSLRVLTSWPTCHFDSRQDASGLRDLADLPSGVPPPRHWPCPSLQLVQVQARVGWWRCWDTAARLSYIPSHSRNSLALPQKRHSPSLLPNLDTTKTLLVVAAF